MKNPLTAIQTKVKKHIMAESLCRSGDKLLLAVSGGADSMAMLRILNELKETLGISLCAAHFDHMTRNGDSTAEGDMVEGACKALNIPCIRGRAEENAFIKGNFENEARRARYAFLREAAGEQGCNLIATAHHRDDQAETVLLQLVRGCGVEGLSGIEPKMGEIIRPLLILSREEIELYCREQGIEYASDSSNADTNYRRNKIRLQLIPQLKALNPAVSEALSQTAAVCREENAFMNMQAQAELSQLCREEGLDYYELLQLPLALQRRIVRIYCEQELDMMLSFRQTEALLHLKQNSHVRLAENAFALLQGGFLRIASELPHDAEPFVYNQFKIGVYDLGNAFFCQAEILPYNGEQAADILWLPEDYLPRLSWRGRQKGDKIHFKGMEGRKSVKAIMNEAHLPQSERAGLPLLLCGEEIIWLPFLAAAPLPKPVFGEKAIRIQICRK